MKKIILSVITCALASISFSASCSANAEEVSKSCSPIIVSENNIQDDDYIGWDFHYISDTDFEIIVPYGEGGNKTSGSYEESITRIETRSASGVAAWVFGTCQVIQWVSNKDICGYLVRQSINLLKTTGKPLPNGKYKVTYTYVSGRVPGCKPIHSGVCNSGYWKITYQKIG